MGDGGRTGCSGCAGGGLEQREGVPKVAAQPEESALKYNGTLFEASAEAPRILKGAVRVLPYKRRVLMIVTGEKAVGD